MEDLVIQSTPETPSVRFVPDKDLFEISGFSLPENVVKFYQPIMEWLDEYFKNPKDLTVFTFKIKYFNTASSKMLTRLFLKLEEINEKAHNIKVKWHYTEDDEEMQEAGEEFREIINLPIEIVPD